MSIRRSHQKSRLGCKNCKGRRVKCDEVRPACGGCLERGAICDFSLSATSTQAYGLEPVKIPRVRTEQRPINATKAKELEVRKTPIPSVARPPCEYQRSSISTPTDRLLELRIFHHYITMTTEVFNSPVAVRQPFFDWLTGLAFRTPSLMDALIGFSAFHLRCLHPSDDTISQASHKYMARAIAAHSKELQEGIHEKNTDTLFATSVLIAWHTIANRRTLNNCTTTPRLPLHWFSVYQGVDAILNAARPWYQSHVIRYFVQGSVSFTNLMRWNEKEADNMVNLLLSGLKFEKNIDEETLEAYRSSVTLLSTIYSSPVQKDLLKFPSRVTERFVKLLSAHDPRALTIMGCYLIILKLSAYVWWMKEVAEDDFQAILYFLPEDYRPRMRWVERELQMTMRRTETGASHS